MDRLKLLAFYVINLFIIQHAKQPDIGALSMPKYKGRVQRAPTVGDVVRGFKSSVTKRLNAISGTSGQRFWQRNYYEHIIRNEDAYLKIAAYIQTNPQRWETDTYHV